MKLTLRRFRDRVYRAHHPRWSFNPTSGDGAALHGGRFNRKGVAALYTSLRPETAWLEAQQGFAFKAQPVTLCAYEVDCADVLDLSTNAARKAIGVTLADLACAWEDLVDRRQSPPTWALADLLLAADVAAIIVPSFAPGALARDNSLVFWTWSDVLPYRVQVIDDEDRLPKDDRSWQ